MTKILETVNQAVWGVPTLVLILGVGVYLTVGTGFAQLRLLPRALTDLTRKLIRKEPDRDGVSPFQALCTALAATVGTGNLAGVAGAMAIGGPGAIFWMWICGILGMVTKFAEATLAVRFQDRDPQGRLRGGPMYMIEKGLGPGWAWLGSLYCFFGLVAAFGVGNCTQINAVVSGINGVLGVWGICESLAGNLVLGIFLAVLVLLVLLGGVKRIGSVAEKLVPLAALGYVVLSCGVLILRWEAVPRALGQIVTGAFNPAAVTGGAIGSAFQVLRMGVSRGVFTNEAGMGTAAMAHGNARVDHPAQQGLMGILEVFLDTLVICTLTALVILVSGTPIPYGTDQGLALTTRAFASVYGDWVSLVLALEVCVLAFATVLGWGLYGVRCAEYLFGEGVWKPFAWVQGIAVVLGAVLNTGTVWLISDTVNGLMAIPSLLALLLLSPEFLRLTKNYMRPGNNAGGGTYEYFHQRQPLRALSHAEIPSPGREGQGSGKDHLSPEHRPAGPGHAPGVL